MVSTIAQFIAQQIMQGCLCQYSASFIVNGQLFCISENSAIYQAQLTSTDDKTALEVHNITQQWVLSGPTVTACGISFKVDPNCSIVVNKLGVTSCHSHDESQPNNQLPAIATSVTLVAVVLIVSVGSLIFFTLYCLCRRKFKSDSLG